MKIPLKYVEVDYMHSKYYIIYLYAIIAQVNTDFLSQPAGHIYIISKVSNKITRPDEVSNQ